MMILVQRASKPPTHIVITEMSADEFPSPSVNSNVRIRLLNYTDSAFTLESAGSLAFNSTNHA